MDYVQSIQKVEELLRRWRELPERAAQATDRESILDVLVEEKNLPHEVHRALLDAAQAGEDFYNREAAAESERIAEIDRELVPLLKQFAELEVQIDNLKRQRRGHEHRLNELRWRANAAHSLKALPFERMFRPEDVPQWLAKLPPAEPPPPAEPWRSVLDI